ncbi:MAG: hypothetical protein M3P83_10590 [Actinomycetota bacterium]|nr:hypothetical protein [Actinomycetota bacterium]
MDERTDELTCPHCGTPYSYGETGMEPTGMEQQRHQGEGLVAAGVAFCPNPECPAKQAGSATHTGR